MHQNLLYILYYLARSAKLKTELDDLVGAFNILNSLRDSTEASLKRALMPTGEG